MRYTILLIVAIAIFFTACKKKPDTEHCYICQRYDSTYSNVAYYVKANPPHFAPGQDTLCGYTDNRINYYLKTHVTADTTLIRYDTLVVNYSQQMCEQE